MGSADTSCPEIPVEHGDTAGSALWSNPRQSRPAVVDRDHVKWQLRPNRGEGAGDWLAPCAVGSGGGAAMGVPCYSARFIQPFAQVLSTYDSFDLESLDALNAIDPAGRIPVKMANELAVQQVAAVGDADLGLKAAQVTAPGRGGALEYAMNSAPTLRDALDVGARFAPLYCDALRIRVDIDRTQVTIRFDSSEPAPRTIHDYAMAMWYANYARAGLSEESRLQCLFGHPKPPNTIEYDRFFGPIALRFGTVFYGFAFDREYLDAPLPAADPQVHIVLCEHLSRTLSQVQDRPGMVDRVRKIAMKELFDGKPTVGGAASALRMSTRTLAGRLEREGTTFSALVDEMRRELALRYLGDPHLSPAEISFRLGFSHVESFYRAFKRWTGETPVVYRREHKSAKPAAQDRCHGNDLGALDLNVELPRKAASGARSPVRGC